MKYRLGIDLGGTNIVAAVVDEKYKIVGKASCNTAVPRPEEEICDSMAEVALKAVAKAKLTMDDIKTVGIGVPGAVNPETGVIEYSANLFFHNWEVVKMMEERLGKKVIIENDANWHWRLPKKKELKYFMNELGITEKEVEYAKSLRNHAL